jgi:type I restriction-modification system DNA methylase subunit
VILSDPFDQKQFSEFIEGFLPDFKLDLRKVDVGVSGFSEVLRLGESSSLMTSVLIVRSPKNLNSRISLTNNSFRILKNHQIYRALIVYVNEDESIWRLSLLTALPTFDSTGKIIISYSNPRRHSYVLGSDIGTATARKYLLKMGSIRDFEDLSLRFSVEVVNDDFFREIASLFDSLVGTSNSKGLLIHPGSNEVRQQYAVRLIGRILFSWFLSVKQDEYKVPLVSKQILSSKAIESTKSYLDEVLNILFFEVLNTPIENRIKVSDEFSITPFLNGGLFSPRNDDYYSRDNISGFSVVKIPNTWMRELFELFEVFNFTIDENSSVDMELSIDPEILGRIFENLLARLDPMTGETIRSLTGSFYTPREIVDRIVDSALITFLQRKSEIKFEKLIALFTYDLVDDTVYPLNPDEKILLVRLISEMTILDPACGSGAFPIGALQRILFVLGRLDPRAEIWLENQFKSLSPELRKIVQEEIKSENFDYVRKLTVIRSNIFGVDIQPIAAEIAKLRCFLTLIVEQDVHSDKPNRGVHILPNLEFKFVTANTLIPLHESEGLFGDELELVEKIQEIRAQYFATENSKSKTALHQKFVKLIKDQKTSLWESSRLEQIKTFRPFDSESSAEFFESEFMFGIKNFDVIVGNPPYIDSQVMVKSMDKYRNELRKHYESAIGNWDLFVVFLEKSINMLNPGGVMSMIVKNQLIGANYASQIRRILSKNTVDMILDYSEVNVFKSASVYPVIIQVSKTNAHHPVKIEIFTEGLDTSQKNEIPIDKFYNQEVWGSFFASNDTQDFISLFPENIKLETLPYLAEVSSAGPTGEAYKFKEYIRDLNPKLDKERTYKRFINTGTIDPFESLWGISKCRYLKDDYNKPVITNKDILLVNEKRLKVAELPKIIIGGMSKRIEAFLDQEGIYMPGITTFYISIEDSKFLPELKFLTGVLNSDLISYWFAGTFTGLKMAGGYMRISHKEIRQIPIVIPSKKQFEKIVSLVDILADTSTPEEFRTEKTVELNLSILKLYGISETAWKALVTPSS